MAFFLAPPDRPQAYAKAAIFPTIFPPIKPSGPPINAPIPALIDIIMPAALQASVTGLLPVKTDVIVEITPISDHSSQPNRCLAASSAVPSPAKTSTAFVAKSIRLSDFVVFVKQHT